MATHASQESGWGMSALLSNTTIRSLASDPNTLLRCSFYNSIPGWARLHSCHFHTHSHSVFTSRTCSQQGQRDGHRLKGTYPYKVRAFGRLRRLFLSGRRQHTRPLTPSSINTRIARSCSQPALWSLFIAQRVRSFSSHLRETAPI